MQDRRGERPVVRDGPPGHGAE